MHGRITLIAAGCAALVGAMLLIPGGDEVAVADTPAVATATASFDSSQETIAAIDAMLGTGQAEAAPVMPKRTITEADRNLMTAALSAPATDMEGAPLLDPNLRPDSIGPSAVNLRAGPSSDTATISVLQPGQALQTGESDGGWVEVTLPDGTTGWVFSRYLASVAAVAATETAADKPAASERSAKAVVNARNNADLEGRTARIDAALLARAKPNGLSRGVFRTEPGERVKIVDVRGKWLRIVTADGSSGWIERG